MQTRVTTPVTDNSRKCENKDASNNAYYNYASHIDIDSELKNIVNPLDTDADFTDKYMPNTNSDLYLNGYNTDIEHVNEGPKTSGGKLTNSNDTLYNHTRQQLKML